MIVELSGHLLMSVTGNILEVSANGSKREVLAELRLQSQRHTPLSLRIRPRHNHLSLSYFENPIDLVLPSRPLSSSSRQRLASLQRRSHPG